MATNGKETRKEPKQIKPMKFTVMTCSKWLSQDEKSVFCNVMESGDILELELTEGNHWGIGLRIENSKGKGPETIEVVNLSLTKDKDAKWTVRKEKLDEFWQPGVRIRINNESDRTQKYHDGEQIRRQVEFALHSKQKWHNAHHFVHWCRHGETVPERKRQGSDVTMWGSLSATASAWMFMRSRKRYNTE